MEQTIRVGFLTQDSGLGEVIARALGSAFATRTTNELHFDRLNDLREWCDVVLLDLRAKSTQGDLQTGLRIMDQMSKTPSDPPVVVLCDADSQELILTLIQHGAYDNVTSPPNMIELRLVLGRAFRFRAVEKELERLRATAPGAKRLHGLHGTSPAMQELFALAQKIALCDVSVVVTGETGTGKELLARAIHQSSARASRPLVTFSCVNMPDTLIEDELFGHEKGAFTGALAMRRGRVEAADQGTLFLDEIGDINLSLQPKLLRVLQERSFERLGGNGTINVNIRLICATNRDLAEMVRKGTFREDLYYRLNVVHMHIPPLRDRRDDIPVLAQLFLQSSAQQFNKTTKRFSPAAFRALEEYSWPGNVRELENTVQRAVVLSEDQTVDVCHLPPAVRNTSEEPLLNNGSYEEEVRQFKRRLLLRTLRTCGWRKAESARTLDIARGYLHRLINQLDISHHEASNDETPRAAKLPVPRQFN